MSVAETLRAMGLELPRPAAPVAAYVPVVRVGALLFVSGQISVGADGEPIRGRLGDDMDVEAGQEAARRCALAILAAAGAELGSPDLIERVVKLGVFVQSTPEFTQQPQVANGASELFQAVLGDAGRHARAAVSAPALPLGVAVEVDAILHVR